MLHVRQLRTVSLIVILFLMGGLSCQKLQVAEKKEVLSLRLQHTPVHDHIGPGGQQIRATIISTLGSKEVQAELTYWRKGEEFIHLPMTPTDKENEYRAVIPQQPKATIVEYYIKATSITGAYVTLPKGSIETGESYTLTFKGHVPPGLSVVQFLCILIGLFLLLVAGYWAFLFLKKGEKLNSLSKAALGGTVFLFLGGIPLYIVIKFQALGTAWSGIPLGTDRTDSLMLLLILYWIGVLISFKGTLFQKGEGKNFVSNRTFATLVLTGAILTVIISLISS